MLPLLSRLQSVRFQGICTASGLRARDVGERFGFHFCCGEPGDLLGADTDVVFIASPDHTHAELVAQSLSAGKHVFTEKPLCVKREQLAAVADAAVLAPGHLCVGFNRGFAPLTAAALDFLAASSGPTLVTIRVNAGPLDPTNWVERADIGHGRIINEACHFIDLSATLCGALPVRVAVRATASERPPRLADNVAIYLAMANGSVAIVIY
ncbi:MAG: Gfo/Idh/MocA family oxidoreductase, partial [Acetobacteraceae bacterium]|nr:Gfo/Idh/MocA family oxidoreductase [Acetobacteraceae bacterium]